MADHMKSAICSVHLSGHALCLTSPVCPIILLTSLSTLSQVRDSFFCVHLCASVNIRRRECSKWCQTMGWRGHVSMVPSIGVSAGVRKSVRSVTKIKPDKKVNR